MCIMECLSYDIIFRDLLGLNTPVREPTVCVCECQPLKRSMLGKGWLQVTYTERH